PGVGRLGSGTLPAAGGRPIARRGGVVLSLALVSPNAGRISRSHSAVTPAGAEGEGVLIAQVSTVERYPGSLVARASKLLSDSDWNGLGYRLRTNNPAQV